MTVYFHELEKLAKFRTGMCFVCFAGKKKKKKTVVADWGYCRKWSNWVGDSDKLHRVSVC